ncbi:hypothetical protein MLD38_029061 [Melastoma candidum]|uniref:Uncharacterized protein n=1 Tax=Melastoma candidum TaxID=119954 RepID=A0ACB9N4Q9_9MYRT|nr:hypothetical protein MLD38_029061 [Melastoma candidum]
MIDCVDIYHQPAFRNPLHKDHKLQGYNNTGCYDLLCPGFVQIYAGLLLGITLRIYPFTTECKWYWPRELFTHIDECAMDLSFGGTVKNKPGLSYLFMGYGFFPSYNTFRSDYFKNIQYIGSDRLAVTPLKEQTFKSENSPECYKILNIGSTLSGYTITYWGHSGQNC